MKETSVANISAADTKTPDHYYPLLTALGAAGQQDSITVFNDYCELASLSMTSYLFESPDNVSG